MTDVICLNCGSSRVHRSRRHNVVERAALMFGGRPCRCHGCNARFTRFGHTLVRIASVQRAAKGLAITFLMITAAAVVLAAIIWLSHGGATAAPAESCAHGVWSV